MEALLIDEWLGNVDYVEVRDEASISVVRQRVREIGSAQRLRPHDTERLATAASELGRNQLRHASRGHIAVRAIDGGVEVIAADRGQGIDDPTTAMAGLPRPSGSLGVGMAAACELADAVDFDIRIGEGTCIWARKYAMPGPRRRQVGIFGRAHPGERESGDHARFLRRGEELTIGVCDGLGHGPAAHDAARTALSAFASSADQAPDRVLEACHSALARTRGAVMAVARVTGGDRFEASGVGNVIVETVGRRTSRRIGSSSFVLGAPPKPRVPEPEGGELGPHDALLIFTDGISARAAIHEDLDLLRQHPIVIAHQVAARFGRANDDLLVCVVR